MAKKKKEEPQYLGVDEFASRVGYSSRHIRRLIQAGEVRASRATERRKWQIPVREVDKFRGKPKSIVEQSAISEREGLPTEQPRQANIDPVTVTQRKEHFAQLTNIAKSLLANDLESVIEHRRMNQSGVQEKVDYIITDQEGFTRHADKEDLSKQLDDNLESTFDQYQDWFIISCFIPHLEAELVDLSIEASADNF